jgi:hypothetical protein
MKHVASHFGGTRDPWILSWPTRIKDYGGLRSQYTHVTDVAPTVYEVAGIKYPAEVDGVKQQPLSGTSFAYTFDRPNAPSRHRLQLFEQEGNRSIYQDGWVAAARHSAPWQFPRGPIPRSPNFEQDHWELYHLDDDYSEAHDVAALYPQKIKEMKALFDREARANNIYPLRNPAIWKPPSAVAKRREFVFDAGLPRIPTMVAPDFAESSYVISADLVIPDSGAEGTILAYGGRWGGFAFFVWGNRLVYETNDGEKHTTTTSNIPLPSGKNTVTAEFIRASEEAENETYYYPSATGSIHLYINGRSVGETPLVRVVFDEYTGTLGVGRAFGSPVSSTFQPPFKFSGTLESVRVELK